jgi:hypothetical protein
MASIPSSATRCVRCGGGGAAWGFGGLPQRGCSPARPASGPRRSPPSLAAPPQVLVAQKVAMGVYRGVTTSELDELAAETAAAMTSMHPDYALVSGGNDGPAARPRPPLTEPPFSIPPAAGCQDRGLQPAQEHAQVLLHDVSGWWGVQGCVEVQLGGFAAAGRSACSAARWGSGCSGRRYT